MTRPVKPVSRETAVINGFDGAIIELRLAAPATGL
jgi:hypothetical protein